MERTPSRWINVHTISSNGDAVKAILRFVRLRESLKEATFCTWRPRKGPWPQRWYQKGAWRYLAIEGPIHTLASPPGMDTNLAMIRQPVACSNWCAISSSAGRIGPAVIICPGAAGIGVKV